MASNDITFISRFVKIRQLVKDLKWGTHRDTREEIAWGS
jgi:hypothetical protein